jgi:hypothetical protein
MTKKLNSIIKSNRMFTHMELFLLTNMTIMTKTSHKSMTHVIVK